MGARKPKFRMGARTSNFENFYFLIELHCTSMYISLLSQNQLLCQQVAIITVQVYHIAIHIPSLIVIEGGLEWEPGPRTSNISTFLIEIHYTSIFIFLLPQNKLLCQQVAGTTMELDHIVICIPSLIRIERSLGWELGPRTMGAHKTGLRPPVFLYWPFQGGTSVVVPYCSCCLCLYFGSSIMLVTYFVNFG